MCVGTKAISNKSVHGFHGRGWMGYEHPIKQGMFP